MPKILENVKESLVDEMKKQIYEKGYSETSVRSVAKACGIATGTVYNYFSSKDAIIAEFMAGDWENAYSGMKKRCKCFDKPVEVIGEIYKCLSDFVYEHRKLFEDPQASSGFSSIAYMWHGKLVGQIAEVLKPSCEAHALRKGTQTAGFIAETMLNWCMNRKDIAEYNDIVSGLFD